MKLSEMQEGKEYTLVPFTKELEKLYRQEGPGLNPLMVGFAQSGPRVKVVGAGNGIVEIEEDFWSWMAASFVEEEEVELSVN